MSNLSTFHEPTSYNQARTDKRWIDAMNHELKALEDNDTWDLVPLPLGKKLIG